MTVMELVERYLQTKIGMKPSTRMNYNFVTNILEKEDFSGKKIGEVKTSDDKLFLIKLQHDGKRHSTVKTVRGVLRSAFQMAVDDDCLQKNPFSFEIAVIITHATMYVGWPKGWAVFRLAKEVWNEEAPAQTEKDKYQNTIFFPIGDPNPYGKFFVGQSYLAPVSTEQVPLFNVTFEPSYRNNWHIHHAKSGGGQMLICVGGRGYYQEWGKDAVELTPGKVINIPAEVKHWHGAAPDSWFSHLAIEVAGDETSNEWLEAVSDEDYGKLK